MPRARPPYRCVPWLPSAALMLNLAAVACAPSDGETVQGLPPEEPSSPVTDAELRALLDERESMGFQGAVLVDFQGVRRVEQGFGTLSEGSSRVPDADTAFDCGSIMKNLTEAMIFLLEEDGALSRQQTLAESLTGLVTEVPPVWRNATLDQVITHSAGFDEYHDTEGDFEAMDRATALERILAQQPLFEPGTANAYSNSGFTLLAAVIEQVTGEEFPSAVRRRILGPLGMSRSGFYGEPLWDDGNVAVGSGADVFEGNDPAHWPPPTWALMGNGGLVSSLHDLLRLARAFDGDELFQPETREAFERAQPSAEIAGQSLVGYAGGNDFGFDAVVGKVASDATYVVAASHVAAPVNAESVALELLEVLYEDELTAPEAD
jgi:CubicO group peptidase (beta-lactamase class C family)